MRTVISRELYFQTGLEVLSEHGYGGLKLAALCKRLGVTTGSFYHYFASWSVYTGQLVRYWVDEITLKQIDGARAEPNPRKRIDELVQIGLTLPHGAEAAIRAWGSADPEVHAVQAEVDRIRYDFLYESALEFLREPRQAQMFTSWAMYLLVGYEQLLLPRDGTVLEWIADQLLHALDSARLANASGD